MYKYQIGKNLTIFPTAFSNYMHVSYFDASRPSRLDTLNRLLAFIRLPRVFSTTFKTTVSLFKNIIQIQFVLFNFQLRLPIQSEYFQLKPFPHQTFQQKSSNPAMFPNNTLKGILSGPYTKLFRATVCGS